MMRKLTLSLAFVGVLASLHTGFAQRISPENAAIAEGYLGHEFSYVEGKKYDFAITADDLRRSPSWNEKQDQAPLSPREAVRLAREELAKLLPDGDRWELSSIILRPTHQDEKWYYVVEFLGPPPPGANLEWLSPPMRVVVLMDGTATQPEISSVQ